MSKHRTWSVLAAAVIAIVVVGLASPSDAADYRYWTYWANAGSSWSYSQLGPASTVPKDGDTEGWRFAVSSEAAGGSAMPRIAPDTSFDKFCGGKTAKRSQKRVAVVFDFGLSTEAPPGESPLAARGQCAIVASGSTGAQILAKVARVRSQSGLICAIDGYPANECAAAVKDPDQAQTTPKPRRPSRTPKPERTAKPKKSPAPTRSQAAPTKRPTQKPPSGKASTPKDDVASTSSPSKATGTKPNGGKTNAGADSPDDTKTGPTKEQAGGKDNRQSESSSKPSNSPSSSPSSVSSTATGSGPGGQSDAQDGVKFAEAEAPALENQNSLWLLALAAGTILGLAAWGVLRRRRGH